MLFNGIVRNQKGEPLAPCTCCGYSGHGVKTTRCGWCEEEQSDRAARDDERHD